jgi:hypothetical protein
MKKIIFITNIPISAGVVNPVAVPLLGNNQLQEQFPVIKSGIN